MASTAGFGYSFVGCAGCFEIAFTGDPSQFSARLLKRGNGFFKLTLFCPNLWFCPGAAFAGAFGKKKYAKPYRYSQLRGRET
jgi:hypothetical protein